MTDNSTDPKISRAVDGSDKPSAHSPTMTADKFSELVRQSKLVDEDYLTALLQTFQQRRSNVDARVIAELLVQAKLLSAWQVDQLLQGQSTKFFLGRYKLLSRLGSGAMGVVYLAEHVRMRRRAALKVLPSRFVEDAGRLELFYRESEATAALDHPNVVRAYDVDNEGETYYLVMEYVDGVNFYELITKNGPLPYAAAAEYIKQAADGLAHAHERGIIHRDVKPANLMLGSDDRVKILDMGLSHWEEITVTPKLATGELYGTPDYISPELALGGAHADKFSDIYSLGCTFYYFLTGHPPYIAGSVTDVIQKHMHEPLPTLVGDVSDLPHELEDICLRMMAKNPKGRFTSAEQIRDAIANWQSNSQPPAQQSTDRRDKSKSIKRHTVLVAEDDEVTRQMLVMQLQKAGFKVRAAGDGQEAMDMMDSQITVCLFDLNMPRASGMDCLRYVHSHFTETPVIILTASDEIQDAIIAMREGAFDYLTKPCRITNVLARVEQAIQARTRRDEYGASLDLLLDNVGKESSQLMETIILSLRQKHDTSFGL